jgi:hypothetical protein
MRHVTARKDPAPPISFGIAVREELSLGTVEERAIRR